MPRKAKTLRDLKNPSTEHRQFKGQEEARTIAQKTRDSARWKRFRNNFKRRSPICVDPLSIHQQEVKPVQHVHHVISINKRPELAYKPDNCASLCTECHGKIEALERKGESTQHLFINKTGGHLYPQ